MTQIVIERVGSVRERWVLAFDASCVQCQKVADAVSGIAGGRLDVLALGHPDVLRWRETALGAQAPWAPTLIHIRGDAVNCWSGRSMGIRMVRHLGIRKTLRLLTALGALKEGAAKTDAKMAGESLGRKQFMRLAAGTGVAAGLVLIGKTPAFAESPSAAAGWVRANSGNLPQHYDDFIQYSKVYRQAIYTALPPQAQGQLWSEHLDRYVAAHPGLTAQQREVVAQARQLVSSGLLTAGEPTGEAASRLHALRLAAIAAYGQDEAGALIATLGPKESRAAAAAVDCECTTADEWWCDCVAALCTQFKGCGTLWQYRCNGLC
ncbi:bacteriocin fulvocin C-related protein [Microbispora sp. NPDC049633]|uniref:bacteriocin fulvocin C-related protein n=1 Tax=Microbispora sp. NPDC049633 TaxID=3154355 RepID=UPI0034174F4F